MLHVVRGKSGDSYRAEETQTSNSSLSRKGSKKCQGGQSPKLQPVGKDPFEDLASDHRGPASPIGDFDFEHWRVFGSSRSKDNVQCKDNSILTTEEVRSKRRLAHELQEFEQLAHDVDEEELRPAYMRSATLLPDSQEASERLAWPLYRRILLTIFETPFPDSDTNIFDSCMAAVIVFNIIVMVFQTDATAACLDHDHPEDCVPPWITITNFVLLGVYTTEVLMRLALTHYDFFFNKWNMLDVCIVVFGIADAFLERGDLQKVSALRVCRVARIIRVLKILKRLPTLHMMINGFAGAMQAMLWGLVLIMLLLMMWSILAVELIYPENRKLTNQDEWCQRAFSSVFSSTLLFFQTLVAGDSWGTCAIPIIERAPLTYALFALALVSVQLGFTNLVLAIIVDKAAEAREGTKADQIAAKKAAQQESLEQWLTLLTEMDEDKNGTISESELLHAYRIPFIRNTLTSLNISRRDLKQIFSMMDHDHSGEVPYKDFLAYFYKAQTQDQNIYLMTIKLQLEQLEQHVQDIARLVLCSSEPVTSNVGPGKHNLHSVSVQSQPSVASSTIQAVLLPHRLERPSSSTGDVGPAPSAEGASVSAMKGNRRSPMSMKPSISSISKATSVEFGQSSLQQEIRGMRRSLELRLDNLAADVTASVRRELEAAGVETTAPSHSRSPLSPTFLAARGAGAGAGGEGQNTMELSGASKETPSGVLSVHTASLRSASSPAGLMRPPPSAPSLWEGMDDFSALQLDVQGYLWHAPAASDSVSPDVPRRGVSRTSSISTSSDQTGSPWPQRGTSSRPIPISIPPQVRSFNGSNLSRRGMSHSGYESREDQSDAGSRRSSIRSNI